MSTPNEKLSNSSLFLFTQKTGTSVMKRLSYCINIFVDIVDDDDDDNNNDDDARKL